MDITTNKDPKQNLQDNLDHTFFSWVPQGKLNPIHVKQADGVYVTDHDGKSYLDFSSQLMNVNIGHNHPHVKEAIKAQLDELIFVFPGMATDSRGHLGKKLADIAPGKLNKTFFTNGGADAIENAIKIARLYTGRHKIISKYRSYHGATYGAISVGGDPRKLPVDHQQMPGVVHVEDPYCYRCPWGQTENSCEMLCVSHVERVINFEGPENIAAIVLEGESGSSGCIKYPKNYWRDVHAIAKKHGILMISDEVMSGFGRCGKWFAVENHGVEPDIIAMAKGLTSGYIPLGGVMVSDEIADYFNDRPFPLGLTYSSHALACAAGVAAIEVMENEELNEAAIKKGHYIEEKVNALKEKHPCIGDFRNTALLGCLELVENRDTKVPLAPWNAKANEMGIMADVAASLRENGLFTFVRWNWIFIAPPLTISYEDIDKGLDIISNALSIADTACK